MQKFMTIAVAGSLVFLLMSCGAAEEPTPTPTLAPAKTPVVATPTPTQMPTPTATPVRPKYGGQVIIAMTEPVGLDPYFKGRGGNEHNWLWAMFTNLVMYNDEGVPDASLSLAESWDFGPDGKSVTMKLREGVLYHDGNEVTAERVKSELDRVRQPGSLARGQVAAIASVDVLSKYELRLNLSRPSAPLIVNLGDRSGMVSSPEAVAKWGKDYGALMVVGSGAFKFKEWVEGSHVTLERFAGYWRKDASGGSLPYVEDIRTPFIKDDAVRLAALQAGQVDIISGVPEAEVSKVRADPKFVLYERSGAGSSHGRINLMIPPMNDVNVRRAMSYAIDRQMIVDTVYFGLGEATAVPLGPAHPWARNLELQKSFGVRPNLDKVREFLAAAGMPNGFEIDVMTNAAEVAEVMQANWAKVGIKANIIVIEGSSAWFASKTVSLYVTTGLSTRIDPHSMVFELHHPKGGYNAAGVQSKGTFDPDPELSRLLEQAEATYDIQERGALYRRVAEIVTLDAHAMYYRFTWAGWLATPKVKGFKLGPEGKSVWVGVWRES